jgi:hypothetical protein
MTDITLIQVDADLSRLNQYRLALEGFRRVMEGREVVTGPTAMAMRIALEDAEVDQKEDKGVTGKDLVTGFKKVAITVRNIIQWLLRTIGKLVEKIGLGMQKLGEKSKKVKQDLKAMPEVQRSALGKGDLPPVDLRPEMLTIEGTFVGNDVEAVNNVIKMGAWINGDFPKMFDQMLGATEQLARKHMKDDTSEAFFKALGSAISSSIKKPTVPFGGESFSNAGSSDMTQNTMPLMGDQGLTIVDGRQSSVINDNNPVEMLRGWFVFTFGEYNTKSTGEVQIPLADFATISKISDMVNASVDANNSGANDVKSLMDKRVGSINKLLDEMGQNDGPGASGEIATAIGVMLQRMCDCMVQVHGWYSRTLNQELGYLGQSIAHVGKGEAEAA